MSAPIRDVVAALHTRLGGVTVAKLHKILYYCQGHHLATWDKALFADPIYAADTGPIIDSFPSTDDDLWQYLTPYPPFGELGSVDTNTVGYVASRYGALTLRDLEYLTRSEPPYKLADLKRRPGGASRITNASMRDFFAGDGRGVDGIDDEVFDRHGPLAVWMGSLDAPQDLGAEPDDLEQIRARRNPPHSSSA